MLSKIIFRNLLHSTTEFSFLLCLLIDLSAGFFVFIFLFFSMSVSQIIFIFPEKFKSLIWIRKNRKIEKSNLHSSAVLCFVFLCGMFLCCSGLSSKLDSLTVGREKN